VGGASVAAILWRGPGRRRPAAPPAFAGLEDPGPALRLDARAPVTGALVGQASAPVNEPAGEWSDEPVPASIAPMSAGSEQDRRKERVIKNEVAFRAYNQRRANFELGHTHEPIPLVCECGNEDCFMAIDITAEAWEAAHGREDQFVVAPEHVYPDLERVIEEAHGYWIVQKLEPPSAVLG
jgi:hypothetical protein